MVQISPIRDTVISTGTAGCNNKLLGIHHYKLFLCYLKQDTQLWQWQPDFILTETISVYSLNLKLYRVSCDSVPLIVINCPGLITISTRIKPISTTPYGGNVVVQHELFQARGIVKTQEKLSFLVK